MKTIMKNTLASGTILSMAVLGLMFASATSVAQDQTSSFVIKLKDANFEKLVSSGSLSSPLEEDVQGKLSSIIVGAENATGQAVTLDGAMSVVGGVATIEVGDSMITQLKTQPVRFPCSGEEFARIEMKYTDSSSAMMDVDMPEIVQERIFYIDLGDNKQMEGTVDGLDNFDIECKFGKVTVPMDYIAGIRFHTDADDQAVIVLTNGDSITGKPDVSAISLQTQWGKADIEPRSMQSLTTSKNATFSQESNPDFGSRWVLRMAIPVGSSPNNFGGFGG